MSTFDQTSLFKRLVSFTTSLQKSWRKLIASLLISAGPIRRHLIQSSTSSGYGTVLEPQPAHPLIGRMSHTHSLAHASHLFGNIYTPFLFSMRLEWYSRLPIQQVKFRKNSSLAFTPIFFHVSFPVICFSSIKPLSTCLSPSENARLVPVSSLVVFPKITFN